MKTLQALVTVIVCATCIAASAAFTRPAQSEVNQAAADPAKLAALLNGATPEEAAQVTKAVVVAALGLGLDVSAQNTRINQIITASVGAMPAQSTAFATALGTSLGGATTLSQNAGLVTTIIAAVTTAGGQQGTALATAFQTAFTAAKTATPPSAVDYGT